MTKNGHTNLPEATADLGRVRSDFDNYGYALIENAMSPAEVDALLTRLQEQAEAERRKEIAFEDGGLEQNWGDFTDEKGNLRKAAFTAASGGVNQRVWMLVNKGKIFRDLLNNRPVRTLIDNLLGNDYLLSSFGANIAKPGGVAMDLHTDQWWMPDPELRGPAKVPIGSITRQQTNWTESEPPELIAPLAAVNIMWMLVDFTEENGATRLVPGSHLTGLKPNKETDVDTIAVSGKAGTAAIFDGRIWHGTGANVSKVNRYGLLTTFCGPMLRTQENFILGTETSVLEGASEDLLALFGFKIWNGYGRVESPLAGFVTRGDSTLSDMRTG
jgi:ectoine hydroxylase-related dioxygenase (phytanoyl-CoA dioxygenase family)